MRVCPRGGRAEGDGVQGRLVSACIARPFRPVRKCRSLRRRGQTYITSAVTDKPAPSDKRAETGKAKKANVTGETEEAEKTKAANVAEVIAWAEARKADGDYEAAFSTLNDLIEAYPSDIRLAKALGIASIFLGRAAEALPRLTAAADIDPSAENLLWLSVAASAAGDDAAAGGYLARGLSAAGDDETALYDLAERFLAANVPSVSAALYRKILAVLPKHTMFDLWGRLHLAACYNLSGDNTAAADVIEEGKKAFEYSDIEGPAPQEVDYMVSYYKGLAAFDRGDINSGADILRDASAIFPKGIITEAALVMRLDEAGARDDADGVYALVSKRLRDAVAQRPEDASAWHDLAVLAVVSGRSTPEGLRAAEWALRLSPFSPDYLDTKAALLYASGRYGEALTAENRAIVMLSAPRWAEAGTIDRCIWRRIEILRKLGTPIPEACLRLPAPRETVSPAPGK